MKLHSFSLVESPYLDKIVRGYARLLKKYFRVTVEGLDHIPKDQPILLAANHSSIFGSDAVILLHILNNSEVGPAHVLAHWTYFQVFDWLRLVAGKFGLCETSVQSAVEVLKEKGPLLIFPEGEDGNFKSSKEKYQLQRFHTGAVRIALKAGVPIVPTVIIGAEESHINLAELNLGERFKNLKLPLPLNLLPLPSKWHVRFGAPIDVLGRRQGDQVDEQTFVRQTTDYLQAKMQVMIQEELQRRPFVYSEKIDSLLSRFKILRK